MKKKENAIGLIIVESSAKVKKIASFISSSQFEVDASLGHIRDLCATKSCRLGVDIEQQFQPNYKIIKGKEKLVERLKQRSKGKTVYLASDPDREGEGIAESLRQVLNPIVHHRIDVFKGATAG